MKSYTAPTFLMSDNIALDDRISCDKWERQIFASICENRELIFSTFGLFGTFRLFGTWDTYISLYIYNMLEFYERTFSGQMLFIFHVTRTKKGVVRAEMVPLTFL